MRTHFRWAVPLTAATGTVAALPIAAQATTPSAQATTPSAQPTTTSPAPTGLVTTMAAGAKPLHPGGPVCFSLVRTDIHALYADALTPDQAPAGYGPSDLRSAYQLSAASASAGGGTTVAVMETATTNGSPVELWDCNGGRNQVWQPGASNSLVNPASGRCLDDPGFSTTNGVQLDIWDCNGGVNQHWNLP